MRSWLSHGCDDHRDGRRERETELTAGCKHARRIAASVAHAVYRKQCSDSGSLWFSQRDAAVQTQLHRSVSSGFEQCLLRTSPRTQMADTAGIKATLARCCKIKIGKSTPTRPQCCTLSYGSATSRQLLPSLILPILNTKPARLSTLPVSDTGGFVFSI